MLYDYANESEDIALAIKIPSFDPLLFESYSGAEPLPSNLEIALFGGFEPLSSATEDDVVVTGPRGGGELTYEDPGDSGDSGPGTGEVRFGGSGGGGDIVVTATQE